MFDRLVFSRNTLFIYCYTREDTRTNFVLPIKLFLGQQNSNVEVLISHKRKNHVNKNKKEANLNAADSDEDPIMV